MRLGSKPTAFGPAQPPDAARGGSEPAAHAGGRRRRDSDAGGDLRCRQGALKYDAPPGGKAGPGLRRARGLPVYGLAAPTCAALAEVAERLVADCQRPHPVGLLWLRAAEGPQVYVDGQPYCLAHTDGSEQAERDLKSEVLSKAAGREVLTPLEAITAASRALQDRRVAHVPLLGLGEGPEGAALGVLEEAMGSVVDAMARAGADWVVLVSAPAGCEHVVTALMASVALLWPHVHVGRDVTEETIEMPQRQADEPAVVGEVLARLPNGEAVHAWAGHCLALCAAPAGLPPHAQQATLRLLVTLFAAFLQTQGMRPVGAFEGKFSAWMRKSPEGSGVRELLAEAWSGQTY